jgi:transcriptional regulator with XRE-family HTH domain
MMQLGEKIQKARIEAGLTQEELAEAVDKKPATVSRWEGGHISPKPKTLARIALATGKPVSWFTRGESIEGELQARLDRVERIISAFETVEFDSAEVLRRLKNLKPNLQKIVLAIIYEDPTRAADVEIDASLLGLKSNKSKQE